MPAVGSTAVATVASGTAFGVGNIVYIPPVGYLQVTASTSTTLTLQNLGYNVNQAPGSTAPSGNTVTATGPQGQPGTPGAAGAAATIAVGTTTTGAPGSNAAVTNTGTNAAAVFNFTVPAGQTGATGAAGATGATGAAGPTGAAGAAATIAAGTTSTLLPGSAATVTNVGSSSAAVFNFGIPQGNVGAAGPTGSAADTVTTSAFTVPAVGSSLNVPVADSSWAAPGQMVYVAGAGGSGVAGALQVTAVAPNQLTLLCPAPAPAIPLVSTSTAGLANLISGNTTDFIDGTDSCQNLANAVSPTVQLVGMRSYNSIGNPNFEVDQRACGTSIVWGATGIVDRWAVGKGASVTAAGTVQQMAGPVNIPGTNFAITGNYCRITLTAAQATLAAGDYFQFYQTVEGIRLREIINDVHSIALLVRSSVASLSFAVAFRAGVNPATTLTKLCTISTANTWTLIQFPNLPVFPTGTSFPITPGSNGMQLSFSLACGTTYTNTANDTWQAVNAIGAVGQSNWLSSPVNSTIDFAFVQHQPGPICTQLMDLPFGANLDGSMGCTRYYQKSYQYTSKPGTVDGTGQVQLLLPAGAHPYQYIPFSKRMAKVPSSLSCFSSHSGAINNIYDYNTTADKATTGSAISVGDAGFSGFQFSAGTTAAVNTGFHWIADTGF
jgi:hypothetical protein